MDDAIQVLRREFNAEEGSFLLRLRGDLIWDRGAFSRLELAMRMVCATYQERDQLERWLAEGFYEMATYVPGWTSHPNFPRPAAEYHEACLERIGDLADWFFRGWHAYDETHVWADL
ncbi:hypothetical protein DLJ47_05780 [Micromonospora sp. S4605]|uniref:hypothetical protein n=1 Tax=Micromonospora sp. S4605 TaxID=1420897 RepID=UPI000D6F5B40|nr:hypothetical protein [Micromonospora sp. S4605]PWU56541.1 hypothetical protein DLJ47_05780 [Micromonospora sp. S4605]